MRDFWIIVFIIVLVVGGSRLSLHYHYQILDSFQNDLKEVEESFYNEAEIEDRISKIEKYWLENERILIILQDHASIDEIEDSLYECFHHYRMGDFNRYLLYREKTISGLEDLIKREQVSLVNIF